MLIEEIKRNNIIMCQKSCRALYIQFVYVLLSMDEERQIFLQKMRTTEIQMWVRKLSTFSIPAGLHVS